MIGQPFWTAERIEAMTKWLEEGLSCSEVARRLGCTRNAVIGKVHRIEHERGIRLTRERPNTARTGIAASRPPGFKRPYVRRIGKPSLAGISRGLADLDPAPLFPASVLPSLPGPTPPPPPGNHVGILDVTGCRWAVGEDDGVIGRHLFCNAPAADGCSYCAAHEEERTATYSARLISKTIRQAASVIGLRFPNGRRRAA